MAETIRCADVRFVKELYPRLREDDAAIERYRAGIDRLPAIVIARDGILVDGYHRWQAHKRENIETISAENLGNISDAEIITHSYRLNAAHGQQLSQQEKIKAACHLYFTLPGTDDERYETIADVLSLNFAVARKYAAEARRETERQKRDRVWDLWLDCWTQAAIADEIGIDQATVSRICNLELRSELHIPPGATDAEPWGRIQHFDIWQFTRANGESSHFGRMPPQVVENLLWGFTNPGDIVVDPFAGGGTTIDVAKAMGRRIWASDLAPRSALLPIHQHNMLDGWPPDAPSRANLILLDPPYWQQAKGEYSADDPADLSNLSLDDFYDAWAAIVRACAPHLVKRNGDAKAPGRLAYIISPTQRADGTVVDHATDMLVACDKAGLEIERRIIVPYQTQQATGQQVTWARENKRWLKLYRDLIVLRVRE
jgi:DNA modification methylase